VLLAILGAYLSQRFFMGRFNPAPNETGTAIFRCSKAHRKITRIRFTSLPIRIALQIFVQSLRNRSKSSGSIFSTIGSLPKTVRSRSANWR
jgi:hypothetical protein